MFPNILSPLSSESKRNVIRSILPRFIESGYSANQSLSLFREQGLGIKRSDFLGIFREVTGEEIRSQRIKFVNKDSVPSDSVLEDLRLPSDSKYRLIGKTSLYDEQTGDITEMFFGWDTNNLMTIEEIESQGHSIFSERYGDLASMSTGFTIQKGFINPNF